MQVNDLKIDQESIITPALVRQYSGKADVAVDSARLRECTAELALVLEIARQRFEKSEPTAFIIDNLALALHKLRVRAGHDIWQKLIPLAQDHPVSEYLQQDPFTHWSFQKPRGYSGDAGLIDIIYKHPTSRAYVADSSALGLEIFDYTGDAATSIAARERRDLLAATVDETAANVEGAEILAVACGHLREAELSKSLTEGKLKRWIALDQDPESLAEVREANYGEAVQPVIGNVAGLMRRSYDLGTFDLVYAAGLYDYLPRAVAVRLTQRLVELSKPGGSYLFANYSDEITTDGYMETFMNWPLILRSEKDMWDIINSAVDRNKVHAEVFYGENRNIIYAKIRKNA